MQSKKTEVTGSIYPDAEYLSNYQNSDISSLISTIGIEAMIGQSIREIGDSGIYVSILQTKKRGEEGINQLRDYTSSFISIIQEALPKMSKKYAEFYQHFLNDFQTNGLHMPMYGKIM